MPSKPETDCTRVLYDGSCPLCSREIAMYQQLPSRQPLAWVDVSGDSAQAWAGKSRDELMQRFHVITPQGEVLDGAQAFVHLWQQLPRWRYLALLARVPGVLLVMEALYRVFLWGRPTLHRWLKRA
jgi:ubiquinone biosynthesis monooxygenase Coq7